MLLCGVNSVCNVDAYFGFPGYGVISLPLPHRLLNLTSGYFQLFGRVPPESSRLRILNIVSEWYLTGSASHCLLLVVMSKIMVMSGPMFSSVEASQPDTQVAIPKEERAVEKFNDCQNNLICASCDNNVENLERARSDLSSISKLAFHLEKRTQEQEDLILLLKQYNNFNIVEKSATPSCSTSSSSPINVKNNSGPYPDNKKPEDKKSHKTFSDVVKTVVDKPQQKPENSGLFSVNTDDTYNVNHQRNPPFKRRYQTKSIIGSNNDSNVTVVPRRGYSHVSRIGHEVTADDILKLLKKSAPEIDITCEEWHRNDQVSTYRVSFSLDKLKVAYDPSIWPNGAEVRRFQFRENFLKNARSSQTT
ncbi:hypothetical protein JTB14_036142 [Gonioctena quinquepunctata]|nr:hypothetical protein JTB14_036142 [Gonioctena quinquepunctata]